MSVVSFSQALSGGNRGPGLILHVLMQETLACASETERKSSSLRRTWRERERERGKGERDREKNQQRERERG